MGRRSHIFEVVTSRPISQARSADGEGRYLGKSLADESSCRLGILEAMWAADSSAEQLEAADRAWIAEGLQLVLEDDIVRHQDTALPSLAG